LTMSRVAHVQFSGLSPPGLRKPYPFTQAITLE
jgi:hypothetical protein